VRKRRPTHARTRAYMSITGGGACATAARADERARSTSPGRLMYSLRSTSPRSYMSRTRTRHFSIRSTSRCAAARPSSCCGWCSMIEPRRLRITAGSHSVSPNRRYTAAFGHIHAIAGAVRGAPWPAAARRRRRALIITGPFLAGAVHIILASTAVPGQRGKRVRHSASL
jgi:hypothetical protein